MLEGSLGPLLWYVISVVVILGLAYWVTRRIGQQGGLGPQRRTGKELRLTILAQAALGKDQRLVVVRAGSRYFLLGTAPGGVTNLAELSEDDISAWQESCGSAQSAQSSGFSEVMRGLAKNRKQG